MSGAPSEAAAGFKRNIMKLNNRYIIPALASLALTATVALAQATQGAQGPHRMPPTAEQMAARRAQFCTDRAARQAARFAFIETRLQLTPAQKPLFETWKAAVQDNEAARQADCAKPRAAGDVRARPTLPERNARMEEMLKTRLAALEKTRGPQEALYNALTPDQQKVLDRAGRRGGMHRAGFRHDGRGGQHGFEHPRLRHDGTGSGPAGNPT